MGKRSIKKSDEVEPLFSRHKSYSASEILAAGGATAFAEKLGKHPEKIFEQLKKLPEDYFLTEDEAARALEMLKEGK